MVYVTVPVCVAVSDPEITPVVALILNPAGKAGERTGIAWLLLDLFISMLFVTIPEERIEIDSILFHTFVFTDVQ